MSDDVKKTIKAYTLSACYLLLPWSVMFWNQWIPIVFAVLLFPLLCIMVLRKNGMALITTIVLYILPIRVMIEGKSIFRYAVYFIGLAVTFITLWLPMIKGERDRDDL